MPNQKAGKNWLVKARAVVGQGNYETIGGLQSTELSGEAENVEVSNHESNGWREYLTDAGLRGYTVSGSGVHSGGAIMAAVEAAFKDRTNLDAKVIDLSTTDPKSYTGLWKVTSFSRSADHNTHQAWSATFVSNGEIVEGTN